jgi:hypothetical protein
MNIWPPRTTLTRDEASAAMQKLPRELHRLLLWLATGQDPGRNWAG